MATTNHNILDFSSRLRKLRGEKSQGEFAQFLGIPSQQTYANYEKGRIPKPAILQRIAQRTGVTLEWLINGPADHHAFEIPSSVVMEDTQVYGAKPPPVDPLKLLAKMIKDMPPERMLEMVDLYEKETEAGNVEASRLLALLTPHLRERIEVLTKNQKNQIR